VCTGSLAMAKKSKGKIFGGKQPTVEQTKQGLTDDDPRAHDHVTIEDPATSMEEGPQTPKLSSLPQEAATPDSSHASLFPKTPGPQTKQALSFPEPPSVVPTESLTESTDKDSEQENQDKDSDAGLMHAVNEFGRRASEGLVALFPAVPSTATEQVAAEPTAQTSQPTGGASPEEEQQLAWWEALGEGLLAPLDGCGCASERTRAGKNQALRA
jgi:hypothetical protein